MNCNYVIDGTDKSGINSLRCPRCGHRRKSKYRPNMVHRTCGRLGPSSRVRSEPLAENLDSVKSNGPTRTDAEVLYIIANHCSWCPNWIPTAKKKKCKACGCGSTETVENLHRRRIKNCPRQNEPAAWTEQMLQSRMRDDSPGKPQAPNPDSA